ncbi:hypothetical protein BHE74_00026039 [Ensete ventricosum]|nr:hypothetical protein GW17_00001202 [Ensete ventricosum]RWW66579.1 hypothetical protein BHE74_00026039 [Ensete ventricosum]RZS04474.1 hypothetical protein BHM03_00034816 [Ensete ventricosum]
MLPYIMTWLCLCSYAATEADANSNRTLEQRVVLAESRREQGIQEIQQQIGEVNEIFKDLALLAHDQGVVIDVPASGDSWDYPTHCGHCSYSIIIEAVTYFIRVSFSNSVSLKISCISEVILL